MERIKEYNSCVKEWLEYVPFVSTIVVEQTSNIHLSTIEKLNLKFPPHYVVQLLLRFPLEATSSSKRYFPFWFLK